MTFRIGKGDNIHGKRGKILQLVQKNKGYLLYFWVYREWKDRSLAISQQSGFRMAM